MRSETGERRADVTDAPERLIVRLRADVGARVRGDDLLGDLRELEHDRLLDALGDVMRADRLITSMPPGKLLAIEAAAARSSGRSLRTLTTCWRVWVRGDAHEIAARLSELPEVEEAWVQVPALPAAITPGDDVYAGNYNAALVPPFATQGYLDPAAWGVDARYAWTLGAEGAGVTVCVLDQGWLAAHQDLPVKPTDAGVLLAGDNGHGLQMWVGTSLETIDGRHGTAAMGVVAAVDNAVGCVGVAPAAALRLASAYHTADQLGDHIADAIIAALPSLNAGDVILLELQRGSSPVETDPADLDAIRIATSSGVTVIEPAGNGGFTLNGVVVGDSGAIVVGAGTPALVSGAHNLYWTFGTNYGDRVDCFAWGEQVVSTGPGDTAGGTLTPTATEDLSYRKDWSGTSSASAIVAGVAALVQAQQIASVGVPLSPDQLRVLLADPANGTAATPWDPPYQDRPIGAQPDLKKLLVTQALVPDVYVRDQTTDDGSVPTSGVLCQSPDIIVTTSSPIDPQSAWGEGSGTENDAGLSVPVTSGVDHIVTVRARNRGSSSASGTTATVYWSPSATLVTPDLWTEIGTSTGATVPATDALTVLPGVPWPKTALPAPGHYCFVALLDHPSDPKPVLPVGPAPWSWFLDLVSQRNNVAWRNFNVVSAATAKSGLEFLFTGAPDRDRAFSFEIRQRWPVGARATLTVPTAMILGAAPPALGRFMNGKTLNIPLPTAPRLRLPTLRLAAGARHEATLTIAGSFPPGTSGTYGLSIYQRYKDVTAGALHWIVRA